MNRTIPPSLTMTARGAVNQQAYTVILTAMINEHREREMEGVCLSKREGGRERAHERVSVCLSLSGSTYGLEMRLKRNLQTD